MMAPMRVDFGRALKSAVKDDEGDMTFVMLVVETRMKWSLGQGSIKPRARFLAVCRC